jgi:hypothetical protein
MGGKSNDLTQSLARKIAWGKCPKEKKTDGVKIL